MGMLQRLFLGRWVTRWLLRGGPWTIAAKLAGMALWGAWKWRRERRRLLEAEQAREIPAEYEVLPPPSLPPSTGSEFGTGAADTGYGPTSP